MDTRSVAGLLGDDKDETAVCDLVEETWGVQCVSCPDGAMLCLDMEVQDLESRLLPSAELQTVTCRDVLASESCMDQWSDWDSDGDGTYDLCP